MCAAFSRRETLEALAVLALSGGATTGVAGARGRGHGHGENEPTLNRFATTVAGAEFTGIYLTEDGQLFFNVQHPTVPANEKYRPGAVGAVTGVDMTELPDDFESVQPPKSPAEYVKTARGSYQVLAEGRDRTRDGKLLGVPYTHDGVPMTEVTQTDNEREDRLDTYGNAPDFNAFIPSDESADEGYLFSNWEDTPGLMSRLHLTQSRDTGKWCVREKMNVDFRAVKGTWNNCFGTVSPWGTPLTSEEYEPPAATWYDPDELTFGAGELDMAQYLGYFGNPYRYGYIVEIDEPQSADPAPRKHYAMGRFAHENAVVMPDRRTAYLSDDGTGTVFFKFIADEPGNLSAGTLYAAHAKMQGPDDREDEEGEEDEEDEWDDGDEWDEEDEWDDGDEWDEEDEWDDGDEWDEEDEWVEEWDDRENEESDDDRDEDDEEWDDDPTDVTFKLDWIELAHGTDEEIEGWIAEYDDQEPSTDANYITDEEIAAWANGNADDDRVAFLESRKAAAALGATDEFRKMEGVNIKRNARPGDFLYMAMSEINESMLPNEKTTADDPQDTIRLEGNDYGAVYRMRLDGNYNVHRMVPAIVGGPEANICGGCPYDARPDAKSTVCQDCAFNPAKDKDTPDTSAPAENAKGLDKATETATGLVGKGMAKLTEHSHSVDPENTIANPDNLVVMPDGRVVIGEDSDFHRPNMLWVYDPKE